MFTAKSMSSSVVNVFHRLFLGMSGVLFFMIQMLALSVGDITQPSRTPVLFFFTSNSMLMFLTLHLKLT